MSFRHPLFFPLRMKHPCPKVTSTEQNIQSHLVGVEGLKKVSWELESVGNWEEVSIVVGSIQKSKQPLNLSRPPWHQVSRALLRAKLRREVSATAKSTVANLLRLSM